MYKVSYANLNELKSLLGITSSTDDTILLSTLERASKEIDSYTGRRFYSTSEVKYFDGDNTLWIPDLLSISASGLQIDELGVSSFVALASTDYIEYGSGQEDSLNKLPITRLEISMNSDYGGFATGIKKGVKISGNWGYGESATPYITDTTLSASIGVATTTCSVTSGTNLNPGMTLLVESEQIYINSGSSPIVVTRGINGTTAVAHASGTQLYYYEYPKDVVQACLDLASALWNIRGKQGVQSERIGDYSYSLKSDSIRSGVTKGIIESILDDSIRSYKRLKI